MSRAMTKRDVLRAVSFGQRIAEDEVDELSLYFVETEQWRRIYAGEVDVVYGAKGSGKSAIYSLLLSRSARLREGGIAVVAAENPRGTPAFKDLVANPPTSAEEFRALWKLYVLALVVGELRRQGPNGPTEALVRQLEEAGLLVNGTNLRALLRVVVDYVRRLAHLESLEAGVKLDPHSGAPVGLSGKITIREPSAAEQRQGLVSVESLFQRVEEVLRGAKLQIWVLLDRLDVAFAESDELEQNALRALFRVYLDMLAFPSVSLKIFLRSDIWRRITGAGFREASHITRHVSISWEPQSLMNLVVRRALRNEILRDYYSVDEARVLEDAAQQRTLFHRIFPAQVDAGERRPETFEWLLSRTRDGSGQTAPRELIHLVSAAREAQLKQLEVGQNEPPDEALFDRQALRAALPEVSKVRLEQTIYAERPSLKRWLEQLGGEKTEQTPESLARVWKVVDEQALQTASELVEIGFFERRGFKEAPTFWVPFLYRDALDMVQGAAE